MSINFNELRELLGAIAQTDITEFTLKSEDFQLTVRKSTPASGPQPAGTELPQVSVPSGPPLPLASPVPPTSEPSGEPAPPPTERKWVPITSPMVGTLYQASAPGEPLFVKVNDRVRPGQTVCIIEAMKLMNEIEAEISGQVMEIVVANGEPVEYGQTLMWIDPDWFSKP